MKRLIPAVVMLWGAACTDPGPPLTVDAKLAHQWQRYAEAQKLVQQRVGEGRTVSRDEWENVLAPRGRHHLTPGDRAELSRRHQAAGAGALARARRDSVIDLDAIRRDGKASALCRDIPKGGMLHVHGQFLADDRVLSELLSDTDPVVNTDQIAALFDHARALPSGDPDAVDFSFLERYPAMTTYSALKSADRNRLRALLYIHGRSMDLSGLLARNALLQHLLGSATRPDANPKRRIWKSFLQRCHDQGVTYLEVTEITGRKIGPTDELEALVVLAEEAYQITLRFLVNFSRRRSEFARDKHAALLPLIESGLMLGVSVTGHESSYPALRSAQTILALSGSSTPRVHRTIHAGTGGGAREVRDVLVLGTERLAHGLELGDDPVVLQYAIERRLPVETSLAGNRKLGFAGEIRDHPFLRYLRLGLPVSLATDNDAVFITDPNNECTLAVEGTDIQYAELRQLIENSLETAFIGDPTKSALRARLARDLRAFESRWLPQP